VIRKASEWLYWQCTDFMINSADLFDVTYRDSNSFLLFLLFPAVTCLLVGWVSWNTVVLLRGRSGSAS
jgi:hypothetical protein